jgi:2-polyprenyl-3-methyl-5-hydroxy-6-metoxy-1,4-benzoquinol methylase
VADPSSRPDHQPGQPPYEQADERPDGQLDQRPHDQPDRLLDERLEKWRSDLASWAIPEHISAAVSESPWVLPRQVFARRADRLSTQPGGPSRDRAWAALDPAGSVLDVGAGAGAACLPLLARTTELTAVDSDTGMLGLLAERARAHDVTARCVLGSWPEVAGQSPAADVVTCHHVLYNVQDLRPFVAELTGHARRLVVAELTDRHPLVTLNGLWLKFHGLRRPDSPTADDLLAILTGMGLRPGHQRWTRPGARDYASFEELTEITRRRLCLPPERAAEVAGALTATAGTGGQKEQENQGPAELASAGREVVTVWWRGTAG